MSPHTLARWNAYAVVSGYSDISDMIRSLWADGLTQVEIAEVLGVTRSRVTHLISALGLSLGRRVRPTPRLPQRLTEYYNGEIPAEICRMSSRQLATHMGVHVVTARRWLRILRKEALTAAGLQASYREGTGGVGAFYNGRTAPRIAASGHG